ncbi:MAG: MMPL family transporter, partial [Oscillospiraceae bacterium]
MSERSKEKNGESFMWKLASFIVDKRNLFFLLAVIALIFSAFSRNWVEVENELAAFLPDDSETRMGLDVMEDQFTTYGTAQVMVANLSLEEAEAIRDRLSGLEGLQSVGFDEDEDYRSVSALYSLTFDYDEKDDRCLEALERVKEELSSYDLYISTELGDQTAEAIDSEVQVIMVYVAIIVVAVLLLTSQTYAEIPVLLLTFVSAMILNMGTNFLLGEISFVSNSVTSILQLALSLDYAVILCNRFKEEHETLPLREAVIAALSKGIPEIGSSSLTTIGGLAAMMFMQFKIGPDMGICLIKAILYALLSVFIIMPGLLMLFGPLMDKTKHKSFIPKIPFVGKFAHATRFIIPPVFVALVVVAFSLSGNCPYAYGYGNLETPKLNETQIAENRINETFGRDNFVALVVPAGDYAAERAMLEELESYEELDYSMGLSNIEAMDGYMLADKLNPREFSELADLDYEMAQLLYTAYAAEHEEYGKIVGGISGFSVPLMDMFLFVHDCVEDGYVSLDAQARQDLDDAYEQINSARLQLSGTEYNRVLLYLTLPESGQETYDFIDTIRETARKYYPQGNIYVVGNSTTEYDFQKSFSTDNVVVSIVSILIVLVVLLFTFKSAGMPVLLILVIQGSIWINFSVPAIMGNSLFFMSYLVVSSIQMGANIDYA